ncbi:MAG: hypothetical protein GY898_30530 [Proteobacteria bacterium]|nr:hypothetical protein [Pseudomonadota bacterium]
MPPHVPTLRLLVVAALAALLMGVSECQPVDSSGTDSTDGFSDDDVIALDSSDAECAPAAWIDCGARISGDTSDFDSGATDVIDGYPVAVGNYAAPELTYAFAAPSTGTVEVRFVDPVPTLLNHDLIVIEADAGVCTSANALDRGFNGLSFEAVAGQTYFVVVDGAEGEAGAFELELQCSGVQAAPEVSDIDWLNQHFVTQIYDPIWNPDASISDAESNNCGPASLAMVMASEGLEPAGLAPEAAVDHARATMYASYPEIDPAELADGAELVVDGETVLVDDDAHPVYFDFVEAAPSLAQGLAHTGPQPVVGNSWAQLDALLERSGVVIAHGHITRAWIERFSGPYGEVGEGPISHFIALFAASTDGQVLVADPMHRGGAVLMDTHELQSFFQSPVSVYDTNVRVIAWDR